MEVPGGPVWLLAWHATPPVFDGPEDRNGRRNHDEAAFWLRLLDGRCWCRRSPSRFVLLGDANLDPAAAKGAGGALAALLAIQRVQDPVPQGANGAGDRGFHGAGRARRRCGWIMCCRPGAAGGRVGCDLARTGRSAADGGRGRLAPPAGLGGCRAACRALTLRAHLARPLAQPKPTTKGAHLGQSLPAHPARRRHRPRSHGRSATR